jgi:hypothetical protein
MNWISVVFSSADSEKSADYHGDNPPLLFSAFMREHGMPVRGRMVHDRLARGRLVRDTKGRGILH